MKTTLVLASLFALALIVPAGRAQTPASATANRDADHEALRALRDRAVAAINNADLAALAACFTTDFAFTAVDQTVITGEEQLREFHDRMFRSPAALVTGMKTQAQADILTRFIDTNTGVCHGTTTDTYDMRRGGHQVTMTSRWTATVVRQPDGAWKVATLHVGTNFLDNPVLKRVTSVTRKLACGALVLGAAFGLFLGLLVGRVFLRPGREKNVASLPPPSPAR
ncbi:MAG: SgcJ/EcaC family oxidoreductase [Opitutaceae bacterium]|jgi:uncharacterized protein (TIGR02246 family)|nr:SgcJ/EcaC family oxidoreductase [Opitutaceae bacterium]